MNVREAKDFLVTQAIQQATIDRVQLSDLERRMMYFTEGPDAVEDPIELNEAFEAEHDSAEYERKMSRLFKHARTRLEKEDAAGLSQWKEAVRELQKGDHYILVLCGELGSGLPQFSIRDALRSGLPQFSIRGALRAIGIIIVGVIVAIGALTFYARNSQAAWLKDVVWAVIIGVYLYFGILPLILKRPPPLGPLLKRLFGHKREQS